jgi:hypothetical protein
LVCCTKKNLAALVSTEKNLFLIKKRRWRRRRIPRFVTLGRLRKAQHLVAVTKSKMEKTKSRFSKQDCTVK